MPSPQKIECVEKTKERLKEGKGLYFTDFTGLTVQSLEELRRELKKNRASYIVVKNTMGFLALKDMGFEEDTIRNLFVGPTGIAIAFDNPITLAKILKGFDKLRIKGCFLEGTYFDASGVLELSKIPSKEVLLSTLLGSLGVISNFVGVLEGVLRSFVSTIDAMKNKEAK